MHLGKHVCLRIGAEPLDQVETKTIMTQRGPLGPESQNQLVSSAGFQIISSERDHFQVLCASQFGSLELPVDWN